MTVTNKWWFTVWWRSSTKGARWVHSYSHHGDPNICTLFTQGYDDLGSAENDWEEAQTLLTFAIRGNEKHPQFVLEISYGPERPPEFDGYNPELIPMDLGVGK